MILSDHAPLKSPWEEVVIRIACKSCAISHPHRGHGRRAIRKNSGRHSHMGRAKRNRLLNRELEAYNKIPQRLKKESPFAETVLVTPPNGAANSGYITDDVSFSYKIRVLGPRLKPGCAEGRIVDTAAGPHDGSVTEIAATTGHPSTPCGRRKEGDDGSRSIPADRPKPRRDDQN